MDRRTFIKTAAASATFAAAASTSPRFAFAAENAFKPAPAAGWRVFDLAEADIHAARGVAIYVEPRKLALGSVQPNLNLNPVRTIRFGKPITASISASNFTNRVKAGVLE